jgi:hypothetical protein
VPGILAALESIDLAKLDLHLASAHGTVSVSGSASLATLDPRDLLGDVGKLLESTGGLPAAPKDVAALLEGGIAELGKLVKLPDLQVGAEIEAAFGDLAGPLTELAGHLGGAGGPGGGLLQQLGGLQGLLQDLASRFAGALPLEVPPPLRLPLQALEQLAKGAPASGAELGQILSSLVLGLDRGGLAAPAVHVQDLLGKLGALGGDLDPIQARMGALTLEARRVTAVLSAPQLDVQAAAAALAGLEAGLAQLSGGALPQALARFQADLGALDPAGAARRLSELLQPVLGLAPRLGQSFEETLLGPLRQLAEVVAAATPQSIADSFAALAAELANAVGLDDLQLLPGVVDDLFDGLVEQLRRIPLRRLRGELLTALLDVEARIRGFDGFSPFHLLTDQVVQLEAAIDGIDLGAIQKRVHDLVASVNQAIGAFPIGEIKTEIEQATGAAGKAIHDFIPAVEALGKQLDGLAAELAAIDFNAAGQAAVDLMGGIRDKVKQAVGSGDIPAPAKAAIGIAAQGLKSIDLSVQVSAPFEQALAGIDPKVVLAPLEPALAKVRDVLEKLTPKSLIAQLDGPFSQVAGALDQLRPEALLGSLTGELKRCSDLLEHLDPRTLAAPLDAEFQQLLAELRKVLDPAPLFAPLTAAYHGLLDLVDKVDLEKALGDLLHQVSDLPKTVSGSLGGTIVGKAGGGGAPRVPVPAAPAAEFRFGDVLRPLAALLAEVKRVVGGAADGVIGEALASLRQPLAVLGGLSAAGGLAAQAGRALAERRTLLDLSAPGGPAAELRAALGSLALSADVALSAEARLSLGPAVAAVRLDAHLEATAAVQVDLDARAGDFLARLSPPDLAAELARLGDALGALTPPGLTGADPAAAAAALLDALFASLDPAPLIAEMDKLGADVQAKLQTLAKELAQGLFGFLDGLFGLLSSLLPVGLLAHVHDGMARVKAELSPLDPAPIQAEVAHLVDVALSRLQIFSPAALAAELGGVFDAVKAKLGALDPAKLLGDLNPLQNVITSFAALRPSVVLAPLAEQTAELELALEKLTSLGLGDALVAAAAKLEAALEVVVQNLEQELDGLLDDLGAGGGGGIDVNVSGAATH